MGIPYLALFFADHAFIQNPDNHRDDLNDWLECCREYAPERLTPAEAKPTEKAKRRTRKAV